MHDLKAELTADKFVRFWMFRKVSITHAYGLRRDSLSRLLGK